MIRRFQSWLLAVPREPTTIGRIIVWWEIRRIPYNLIFGCIGIVSLALFFFFSTGSGSLESGDDAVEPIAIIAAPFLMNLFYTLGWIVESSLRISGVSKTREVGVFLFKLGCAFSLFVIWLPTIVWGSVYCGHVLFHH